MNTQLFEKVRVHRGRCGCVVIMKNREDGWECPLCEVSLDETETVLVPGPEHTMMYGLRTDGTLFQTYFISPIDLPLIESKDRPAEAEEVTSIFY